MDGMYPNAQYPEDDYVDDDIENLVRKIVIQRRPRLNYWFKVSASSSVSLPRVARSHSLPTATTTSSAPTTAYAATLFAYQRLPTTRCLPPSLSPPSWGASSPKCSSCSSSLLRTASSCALDTSRAPSLLASRPTPHPTPRHHPTARSHTHRSHNHPTPPPHRTSTSSTRGVSRRVSSSARCTCRR